MKTAWQLRGDTLTFVAKGQSHSVLTNHPNFRKIVSLLKEDDADNQLVELTNIQSMFEKQTKGKVQLINGQVFYNGSVLHTTLSKRILQLLEEGYPINGLLLFLENLMQNPSFKSREQLYSFLEHRNLPITEDGHFLAYKAIRENWTDKHTGSVNNRPGQTISMERSLIDDDHDVACSEGFHVGAIDYVYWFAKGDDRIVIVKVNPRDAVSVPKHKEYQKLRVCQYTVVREYEGELQRPLYNEQGESWDEEFTDWIDEELENELREMDDTFEGVEEEEGQDDWYDVKNVKSESYEEFMQSLKSNKDLSISQLDNAEYYPYDLGVQDFRQNKSFNSNQFPNPKDKQRYRDGWDDAFYQFDGQG